MKITVKFLLIDLGLWILRWIWSWPKIGWLRMRMLFLDKASEDWLLLRLEISWIRAASAPVWLQLIKFRREWKVPQPDEY